MAAAPDRTLLTTAAVLERSRSIFATTAMEPFHAKGKSAPIQAYAVGPETGRASWERRAELPLVGRDAELALLLDALDAAEMGDGRSIEVTGDAGVGKSRVVDEALARPRPRRASQDACGAVRVGHALSCLPESGPRLLGLGGDDEAGDVLAAQLRASVARLAPGVEPALPLLGDLLHIAIPDTPETSAIEPQFRPDRLADAFSRLLDMVVPGPLVILVDDADWADEASAHLLRRLGDMSVGRQRAVIAVRRPHAGDVVSDAVQIEIGPLSHDHTVALVMAATSELPLRSHEVAAIVQRANGNPLVAEEIVRAARAARQRRCAPGDPRRRRRRGDRLAVPARAPGVAVRGSARPELSPHRSARAPLTEDIVLDEVTRGRLNEFLVDDDAGRLRFAATSSETSRDQGLSYRRRRDFHQVAGEVNERLAGADTDVVADVLALHFSMGNDPEKTWRYARVAADRALAAFANVEASVHLRRAIDASRRLEDVASSEVAALWTKLGDARVRSGEFELALDAYRRASPLLAGDPIAVADLAIKRARARERMGAYSQALSETARADRRLIDLSSVDAAAARARLLAFRAMLRQAQERPVDAIALAEQACAAADATGEREAIARAVRHPRLGLADARRAQSCRVRVGRPFDLRGDR